MSVTTNIAGIGAKRKLEMVLCGTVSSFLASKMVEHLTDFPNQFLHFYTFYYKHFTG